jgi:hypothetical protein
MKQSSAQHRTDIPAKKCNKEHSGITVDSMMEDLGRT